MENRGKSIVFLFGAGASYGAGGIIPENPPLGSDLYENLERIYPGTWGSLPSDFIDTFKENFEAGMELVYSNYGQFISRLMREMAIYFIQFRPSPGKSLYCKLASYLTKKELMESVLFSTLNYDCALEYSLVSQNIKIDYFNLSEEAVPVWKCSGLGN